MNVSPERLTASAAARAIAEGRLTSEVLVTACLGRIADREEAVGAWTFLDPDLAIAQARERDRSKPTGLLHGVPVGIKDIFDTVDMPTTCGTPIYAGRRPEADAACVGLVRRAGAVVLGKTVSTAFAFFPPASTANPLNLEHSPGGSSSGSAAAVADSMVPVAFGSQTAGSVTRPAAYCGVIGYKFSFGQCCLRGVMPFAPSVDTAGLFARSIEDLRLMRQVLVGATARPTAPPTAPRPPRIAWCPTGRIDAADPAAIDALESTCERARAAGAEVIETTLPAAFDDLIESHKIIMAFEAARNFVHELEHHRDELHPAFLEFLEQAQTVDMNAYVEAQRSLPPCSAFIDELLSRFDCILTPAVTGEAPAGLESTGDPIFCRTWTLLHLPTVALPAMNGPTGLSVGVQLVGRLHGDDDLLNHTAWIRTALGHEDLYWRPEAGTTASMEDFR